MGLFKQVKDMKNLIGAAPEMVSAARQLGAQAEQLAAAQQAATASALAASAAQPAAGGPDFAPVGGVSLELYAEISRALAADGGDQSRAAAIAAGHGVQAADWQAALDGWNGRIRTNPAVAQRFNALYTGR